MNNISNKPFLTETIAALMVTPSRQLTLGARILRLLLKSDPSILDRLELNEKVNYWWVTIYSSFLGEVVLCFWLPKSWSERHDHYNSWNITIVLLGKLIARLYHVSGSKFFTFKKAEVGEMGVTTTPSWQIHSLANPFDRLCVSIHFYAFRRPSPILFVED